MRVTVGELSPAAWADGASSGTDQIMLTPREFPETRPSLLATLREGAPQTSWRDFFERYAPAVYRVARLRGLADCDADDIVQQVMLSVSSHIGGFRFDRDRGHFRQWIRSITQSKICDLHRRRQARLCDAHVSESTVSLDSRPDERPGIDELWEQEWRMQDMLWCLDQAADHFSPRRMQIFNTYALEGVSAEEVSRRFGVTKGYVYVTRNHVLKIVRELADKLETGEHDPERES